MREKTVAKDIQIESVDPVYQGFIGVSQYRFRFRQFSGEWSDTVIRECVEKAAAIGVLLHDPSLNSLVLVEQIRIGALEDEQSPWLLELVAGLTEPGESLESVAIREVYEETGLVVEELSLMLDYWVSPGCSNEHFTLFYAQVDASQAGGIYGVAAEHEDIRVQVVEVEQARDWLEQGKINNAALLIGLQWFFLKQVEL